jgi:hypothetical protein
MFAPNLIGGPLEYLGAKRIQNCYLNYTNTYEHDHHSNQVNHRHNHHFNYLLKFLTKDSHFIATYHFISSKQRLEELDFEGNKENACKLKSLKVIIQLTSF